MNRIENYNCPLSNKLFLEQQFQWTFQTHALIRCTPITVHLSNKPLIAPIYLSVCSMIAFRFHPWPGGKSHQITHVKLSIISQAGTLRGTPPRTNQPIWFSRAPSLLVDGDGSPSPSSLFWTVVWALSLPCGGKGIRPTSIYLHNKRVNIT